ncbi:MAG TPA: ERF family protein [Candidatus Saccharimonadales bacterium]|nr:ERF family protein [Candidatus Saccharimonadales bacterium]
MSESKQLNIYQRLLEVQHEVKAPKQAGGRFGKARSAEQVLAEAKPVCYKHGLYLFTQDAVEYVEGRHYIVGTATVVNVDNPEETHSAKAYAWEGEQDRSLDTAQVSGKTSSYAKKYALQHLLGIDDTKDADFDQEATSKQTAQPSVAAPKPAAPKPEGVTKAQLSILFPMMRGKGYEDKEQAKRILHALAGVESLTQLTKEDAGRLINEVSAASREDLDLLDSEVAA